MAELTQEQIEVVKKYAEAWDDEEGRALGVLLAAYEGREEKLSLVRRLCMEYGWDSTGDALDWLKTRFSAYEERGREIEQLKIIEASLESGMRLRQEALDLAEARVEELREAVRLALDALTDAEHYHARACAKDEPHDHPLLRKLQATIPLVDAALAASPEAGPARGEAMKSRKTQRVIFCRKCNSERYSRENGRCSVCGTRSAPPEEKKE